MMSSATNLLSELRTDMRSAKALPALSIGGVLGVIELVYVIVFGSLIFSGPLASHVSQGVAMVAFGSFAICLTIALTGGYRGAISNQPTVCIMVLAAIVSAVALEGGAPEGNALFLTAAAIVIVSSVATGLCFAAIGRFGMADLLRFAPYPVVCGVLAGTGGLSFLAGLSMMGIMPDSLTVPSLLETSVLWNWAPGAAYGAFLFVAAKRWDNLAVFPVSFALGAVLYHMSLPVLEISGDEARAAGLLFASVMEGTSWPPFEPDDLTRVDWIEVASHVPGMLALVAVTLLCGVIYLGSFELATNRELDWNREFRAAGWANVIAGLGGGPAGSINSPMSIFTQRGGAETRLAGMVTALVVGSVLFVGDALLTLVPVPLLAGVLLYIGLELMDDWLVKSRRRLPAVDYAIVLAIFLTVVFVGFAEGVGVGLAIATVLFAARLSRVDSVEAEFTARERSSNRSRPIANRAILLAEGDRIHGYRLRGHLFFGSAHALASRLKQSLERDPPPTCILLDFEPVSGLDFSAVNALCGFVRASHDAGVRVALSGAPENCRTGLERNLPAPVFADLMFETDPDRALERCEDIVIAAHRSDLRREDGSGDAVLDRFGGDIEDQLDRRILFEDMAHELREWLEVRDYEPGEALAAAGAPQDGLQLLLMGRASAYEAGGSRLRQYGPGDAIGVRGAFETRAAAAATVADEPCRTLMLTPVVRRWLEENREQLMLDLYGYLLTAGAGGEDPPGSPVSDDR